MLHTLFSTTYTFCFAAFWGNFVCVHEMLLQQCFKFKLNNVLAYLRRDVIPDLGTCILNILSHPILFPIRNMEWFCATKPSANGGVFCFKHFKNMKGCSF